MSNADLALDEQPMVWCVSTARSPTTCAFCLNDAPPDAQFKRCSGCSFAHYCNGRCQKADWLHHKTECKAIRETVPPCRTPDDSVRLVVRLLSTLASGETASYQSNGRRFEDLESHEALLETTIDGRQRYMEHVAALTLFLGARKLEQLLSAVDMPLQRVYGRTFVNCFGMQNSELQTLGIGLYINLCRLYHSCNPNARLVFQGKKVTVTSVSEKPLSGLSYDAITHSYIDNLMPIQERRAKLQIGYYFDCNCTGCLDEERNREMKSFACAETPSCRGTISVADRENHEVEFDRCSLCGKMLQETSTAVMVRHSINSLLQRLHLVTDDRQMLQACAKTIELVEDVLHKYNLSRMRIYRSAYEACARLGMWKEASRYGAEVLDVYEHFLCENDVYLAVMRKNMAFVYANAQNLVEARKLALNARDGYSANFGMDRTVKVFKQLM